MGKSFIICAKIFTPGFNCSYPTEPLGLHLHHWWHFEKPENQGCGRLKTLPFALLQCWPQFRYARNIWNEVVRKENSQKEREFLEREIASVEPLVESFPQIFIWLGLLMWEKICFGIFGRNDGFTTVSTILYAKIISAYTGVWLGVNKFVIQGPLAFAHRFTGSVYCYKPRSG